MLAAWPAWSKAWRQRRQGSRGDWLWGPGEGRGKATALKLFAVQRYSEILTPSKTCCPPRSPWKHLTPHPHLALQRTPAGDRLQQFLDPTRPGRSSVMLSPDLTWIPWSIIKITPVRTPQLPCPFCSAQLHLMKPDCLLHPCAWAAGCGWRQCALAQAAPQPCLKPPIPPSAIVPLSSPTVPPADDFASYLRKQNQLEENLPRSPPPGPCTSFCAGLFWMPCLSSSTATRSLPPLLHHCSCGPVSLLHEGFFLPSWSICISL